MPSAITRRQLLLSTSAMGLGLLAGCGQWPGQEQPAPRVPRVGWLAVGNAYSHAAFLDAFRQGLREAGYLEGQSLVLEVQWEDAPDDRLAALSMCW